MVLPLVLTVLYCVLCAASFAQVCRILYYKHDLRSFQFSFLSLCFTWTVLRVVWWVQNERRADWSGVLSDVLFRIPINIQFATFSLIVMFYAHILYKSEWARYRRQIKTAYYVSNIGFFALTLMWTVITHDSDEASDDFEVVWQAFGGILFLLLSGMLAYYGWKLQNVDMKRVGVFLQLKTGTTTRSRVNSFTAVILLIFFSRCVYNFLSCIASFRVSVPEGGSMRTFIFCCYLWWEIVPTALVLLFFRHIPRTTLGFASQQHASRVRADSYAKYGHGNLMANPIAGEEDTLPGVGGHMEHLFDDPLRYDSGDEDGQASFSPRFGPLWGPGSPSYGSNLFQSPAYNKLSVSLLSESSLEAKPSSVGKQHAHPQPPPPRS